MGDRGLTAGRVIGIVAICLMLFGYLTPFRFHSGTTYWGLFNTCDNAGESLSCSFFTANYLKQVMTDSPEDGVLLAVIGVGILLTIVGVGGNFCGACDGRLSGLLCVAGGTAILLADFTGIVRTGFRINWDPTVFKAIWLGFGLEMLGGLLAIISGVLLLKTKENQISSID